MCLDFSSKASQEGEVAVGMLLMLYNRECLWHKKFVADVVKHLRLRPGQGCICADENTTSRRAYDFAIPTRPPGGCVHVFHVVYS